MKISDPDLSVAMLVALGRASISGPLSRAIAVDAAVAEAVQELPGFRAIVTVLSSALMISSQRVCFAVAPEDVPEAELLTENE